MKTILPQKLDNNRNLQLYELFYVAPIFIMLYKKSTHGNTATPFGLIDKNVYNWYSMKKVGIDSGFKEIQSRMANSKNLKSFH